MSKAMKSLILALSRAQELAEQWEYAPLPEDPERRARAQELRRAGARLRISTLPVEEGEAWLANKTIFVSTTKEAIQLRAQTSSPIPKGFKVRVYVDPDGWESISQVPTETGVVFDASGDPWRYDRIGNFDPKDQLGLADRDKQGWGMEGYCGSQSEIDFYGPFTRHGKEES